MSPWRTETPPEARPSAGSGLQGLGWCRVRDWLLQRAPYRLPEVAPHAQSPVHALLASPRSRSRNVLRGPLGGPPRGLARRCRCREQQRGSTRSAAPTFARAVFFTCARCAHVPCSRNCARPWRGHPVMKALAAPLCKTPSRPPPPENKRRAPHTCAPPSGDKNHSSRAWVLLVKTDN